MNNLGSCQKGDNYWGQVITLRRMIVDYDVRKVQKEKLWASRPDALRHQSGGYAEDAAAGTGATQRCKKYASPPMKSMIYISLFPPVFGSL